VTPDHDADMSTRALAYLGQMSNLSTQLSNFYDGEDFALNGWEYNNAHFKPQRMNGSSPPDPHGDGTNGYYFNPNADPGEKLGVSFLSQVGRFVRTAHEAMAYVDQSRSRTAGVQQLRGSIVGNVNTNEPPFAFGTDHGAEWNNSVQTTVPFYNELMESFGIKHYP
jgi:hypothetical protein